MSFPQKMKVPVAVNTRSNQNLSGKHLTTSEFMQFNVARAIELVPNQNIDVYHEVFSRLEPLALPTLGGADIRHRAFWIPFRTVFPAWNDFITDSRHQFQSTNGVANIQSVGNVPLVSNNALYTLLTSSDVTTSVGTLPSGARYDFKYIDGTSSSYRTFTTFGRYVWKTLRSLGYSVAWTPNNTSSYSALPLLCLMRVFCDWYYPSQYSENSQVAVLLSYLQSNNVPSTTSMFTGPQLLAIFKTIYKVSYDPSYLVSAWDNPSGPNMSTSSQFTIPDINNVVDTVDGSGTSAYNDYVRYGQTSGLDSKGAAIVGNNTATPASPHKITQFALTALRSLSDYLKRHQLAGSRALDRYLSRFGVQLSAEKLNRSSLIESYKQRIDFYDVTSTSSTETAPLGGFAGKGVSYGDGKFHVDTHGEYGMLIIITTIIPDEFHYQGMLRHVFHKSKLDFFTPEFDALGVQAIAKSEAYLPNEGTSTDNQLTLTNGIFGFTPRYSEYKYGFSQVTGDYDVPSMNVGKEAWTLGRSLKDTYDDNPTGFVHNLNFIVGNDSQQYNRIFQVTEGADHFNIYHRFEIKSSFPGKSLFDDYEFKDEDDSKKVTVDVNGSTVN